MAREINALAAASQQTRDALLEAGLQLLTELPASATFGHLTASKIAGRAGRTTGAFFHQWPTLDAYLRDFVAYVLRPELSITLDATVQRLQANLQDGDTFVRALTRAGLDVPTMTAHDPQTVIEMLMWNRALHDNQFRQQVADHYTPLDASAAPIFQTLMQSLGREPRPPFTPEVIASTVSAVAQGLSVRATLTPGFFPPEIFGWMILTLIPLLTREPTDRRTAAEMVDDLSLAPHPPAHQKPQERNSSADPTDDQPASTGDPETRE